MTLQSVRVRNFKAIVDSGTVRFGPLTAFIGHNGSGKSSLIEALETYQSIIVDGLDVAMQRWLGIEHVRHLGAEAKARGGKVLNAMVFDLSIGASVRKSTRLEMAVNNDPAANRMYIEREKAAHANGWIIGKSLDRVEGAFEPGRSILTSATAGHRKVSMSRRYRATATPVRFKSPQQPFIHGLNLNAALHGSGKLIEVEKQQASFRAAKFLPRVRQRAPLALQCLAR